MVTKSTPATKPESNIPHELRFTVEPHPSNPEKFKFRLMIVDPETDEITYQWRLATLNFGDVNVIEDFPVTLLPDAS